MLSHLTLGSNALERSRAFYDAALEPLGVSCVFEHDGALAYSLARKSYPWVWIFAPFDGLPATWGNGTHVAFMAPSREAVAAFHAMGLKAGGRDEGAPGPRPDYAPDYFAAYLRDPDGNKLQAVHYGEGRSCAPGQALISHVTLGSNDLERSRAFYDRALGTLGLARLYDEADGTAYCLPGTQKPSVSTRRPYDGRPATWGNGTHVAFLAPSREAVHAFHAAALAAGGLDEGEPGLRPHYAKNYYAAYLRDPDGNKLQAVCRKPA